jgi:hypothetical protein
MTDEEVDYLLERFDQTDPKLQRKIVAKIISDRESLAVALEELVKITSHANGMLLGRSPVFDNAQDFIDYLVGINVIPPGLQVSPS